MMKDLAGVCQADIAAIRGVGKKLIWQLKNVLKMKFSVETEFGQQSN
jgi:hypothetical protein